MDRASVSDDKNGIPVFVMLPLNILRVETNEVEYARTPSTDVGSGEKYDKLKTDKEKWLLADLKRLKKADVQGVMVDCWWGIVEAEGPGQYKWDGYQNLFSIVKKADLELHVVMSFHACTDLKTRAESIPLPSWVKTIGMKNDLFYRDAHDDPSTEYLSLAVDKKLVLKDQSGNQVSPLQVYYKFMQNFRRSMDVYFRKTGQENLKRGFITKIEVGLGPSGELRYPAYRGESWTVAGIGEFQCYDKYMMESWKNEATHQALQIPRRVGPQTAGEYNSKPEDTLFFKEQPETSLIYGPNYRDDDGKSFLTWYSGKLVAHGNRVLHIAKRVFQDSKVEIAAKVPGIHWYCNTDSRAAEATAGLFTDHDNKLSVYQSIAATLKRLQATFIFTCAEMKDGPSNATDEPGTLVEQVLGVAEKSNVPTACENASEVTDEPAYNQICSVAAANNISYFTYMRLGPALMENFGAFEGFVGEMKGT